MITQWIVAHRPPYGLEFVQYFDDEALAHEFYGLVISLGHSATIYWE